MLAAILKFLFLILILIFVIAWIYALANWDGKCHHNCKDCPYDDGNCKFKEERKHGQRKPPGTL